jgi:uncharacterized protein with HEPN domain
LKGDCAYLQHVLDEIEHLNSLKPTLTYDVLVHDWRQEHTVIRALEIIGEATKNLSSEIRDAHPEIPWSSMAGLRDRVVHGYFVVDYKIIWGVLQDDIPEIEPKVRALINT